MIAPGVNPGAVQGEIIRAGGAINLETIIQLLYIDAQLPELAGHRGNAVTLLVAQMGNTMQASTPPGKSSDQGQGRNNIRHVCAIVDDPAQHLFGTCNGN